VTSVTSKTTKVILVTTVSLVIIVALFSVLFFLNQTANNPPTVDYWILNISSSGIGAGWIGAGYVTPNGTVYVPMNQTGLSVTATAKGWNGFAYWILDGEQVANQSSTIFVPKQQLNSSHMLSAVFMVGTPPIYPIVDGIITVNASSYKDYNFTVPSGSSQSEVQGTFTVSGGNENDIKVYIMDSTNFANWQNGQNASSYYNSGEATNGTIAVTLYSGGTHFLVYDNTFDTSSQKTVDTQMFFWCIPKD
jgi:hypothetical protein